MKLNVSLDGNVLPFECSGDGESVQFRLGDAGGLTASLVEVEPGIYSVLVNGASYEAKVVPGSNGTVYVDIGGRHFAVEVLDPRQSRNGTGGRRKDGPREITAPMPGRVVRVLVQQGDQVLAGQGLIVIEAMKMQNELKAPKDGRIVSLRATEGETVAAGNVLATVE